MSKGTLIALVPAVIVPVLLSVADESLWPAILIYHAFCVGAPLAFRWSAKEAGFGPQDLWRWLPLTLTAAALLLASGEAARHLVDVKALLPQGWDLILDRAHPWWAFVGYSLLVNALAEEYFWRGFLLRKIGIAWSGTFFWAMHAAAGSVFVDPLEAVWLTAPALIAGLVWGWMRQRFDTLLPSVITHLAADVVILRVASDLLRQT